MKLLLVVTLVLSVAPPALAADHPLLVTPAWPTERRGLADVRIVDLSDAGDYARGHIPGAVHFDIADALDAMCARVAAVTFPAP